MKIRTILVLALVLVAFVLCVPRGYSQNATLNLLWAEEVYPDAGGYVYYAVYDETGNLERYFFGTGPGLPSLSSPLTLSLPPGRYRFRRFDVNGGSWVHDFRGPRVGRG